MGDRSLDGLLEWLAASGAETSAIQFAPSQYGGTGAIVTRKLKAGELLASIPHKCVLSSRLARMSPLGKAMRRAAADLKVADDGLCSDAVMLWTFMAVGRRDPSNPFHAYLLSLPEESPEPACWSDNLRRELSSTPAGVAVAAARAYVHEVFERFVSQLPGKLGEKLVPRGCLCSAVELLWARGARKPIGRKAAAAAGAGGGGGGDNNNAPSSHEWWEDQRITA